MADLSSLAELGTVAAAEQPAAPVHVQKLDKQGRAYATGKRKDAIARVWVKPGTGKIVVNGRVAASKPVPADGTLQNLAFSIPIERSSWVALRLMGAGHSNPVFVLVDNKPVRASRASVEWSQRALLQAYDAESSRWSPEDAPVAAAAFQYAYEIYGGILNETETP